MRLKASSAKWRPFCLGLSELTAPAIAIAGAANGESSVKMTFACHCTTTQRLFIQYTECHEIELEF